MAAEYRLEEVAEMLDVPASTVVSWLAELGHSVSLVHGRWHVPSESVEALKGKHRERKSAPRRRYKPRKE